MIYVATDRLSFAVVGLLLFGLGAYLLAGHIGHISDRIDAWHRPFDPTLFKQQGGSYQLAQGLFAQADGGIWGAGFGQAVLDLPRSLCPAGVSKCSLLPAPHTDFIYAVITDEPMSRM
jgi:cell division protein FtsW (lipid II flippase)